MDNNNGKPIALTIPQVAEMLQISRSQAYDLYRKHGLTVIRIGTSVRVMRSDFEAWLERQRQERALTYAFFDPQEYAK